MSSSLGRVLEIEKEVQKGIVVVDKRQGERLGIRQQRRLGDRLGLSCWRAVHGTENELATGAGVVLSPNHCGWLLGETWTNWWGDQRERRGDGFSLHPSGLGVKQHHHLNVLCQTHFTLLNLCILCFHDYFMIIIFLLVVLTGDGVHQWRCFLPGTPALPAPDTKQKKR